MGVKIRPMLSLLLVFLFLSSAVMRAQAQDERQIPSSEEETYGSKFFNQLRSLFGKFQDSDLQRSFSEADAIQCSELVSHKGEWRPVAFFNEDRSLGAWCRESLAEVKADLTVFTFKGPCRGDRGTVQVATEFPVMASVEAYNRREIDLSKVDVTVNAPVNVVFDLRTQAYTFELPYLFLTGKRGSMKLYSLEAQTASDAYANDVTSGWECKAVRSRDVTYRFLICRTATLSRNSDRNQSTGRSFGASAFFILSDGVETHTSVNLSFGDMRVLPDAPPGNTDTVPVPGAPPAAAPSSRSKVPSPSAGWESPEPDSQLSDAARKSFRIRFSPQTWAGKLDAPQVLSAQKIVQPSPRTQPSGDYCAWYPGVSDLSGRLLANEPDSSIRYVMGGFNKSPQSPVSFIFDLKTGSGILLAKLQCYFARNAFADDITFDRWAAIVGSNVVLETQEKNK
jgi:hypothetical protein